MTERDVIAKARAVADEHRWTWIEPAQADFEPDYRTGSGIWKVVSNAHAVGMNVRVYIDDATGAVLEKGFLPR